MTEIDLGELPRHGGPAISQRPPWRVRVRVRGGGRSAGSPPNRSGLGVRRWWGTAAVAVLLVTLVADASPPQWASHRFSVPGRILALAGDMLYTVHQDGYQRQTLVAYQLPDGRRAWHVTREAGQGLAPDGDGGALIRHAWFTVEHGLPLHVSSVQRSRRQGSSRVFVADGATTTAFDPATGQPRWARDGLPTGIAEGGLLLLVDDRFGAGSRRKVAVYAATGEVAWHRRKALGELGHDGRVLATRAEAGRLASYDLTDGRQLASVPISLAQPEGPLVVDGAVVLWQPRGRPSVIGYDPHDLRRRWVSAVPAERVSGGCRTVVCVHGPRGVVILAPGDGAQLWSFDWPAVGRHRHLIRELPPPWPPGWLLLHLDEMTTGEPQTWLVDAHTGEVALDLTGWRPQFEGATGHLWSGRKFGGSAWLGRLAPDPLGLEVLGRLQTTTGCAAAGPYLACQASDGVDVWQVRR